MSKLTEKELNDDLERARVKRAKHRINPDEEIGAPIIAGDDAAEMIAEMKRKKHLQNIAKSGKKPKLRS